jgi:hypothetical protein
MTLVAPAFSPVGTPARISFARCAGRGVFAAQLRGATRRRAATLPKPKISCSCLGIANVERVAEHDRVAAGRDFLYQMRVALAESILADVIQSGSLADGNFTLPVEPARLVRACSAHTALRFDGSGFFAFDREIGLICAEQKTENELNSFLTQNA